jgi:hypothetical protein
MKKRILILAVIFYSIDMQAQKLFPKAEQQLKSSYLTYNSYKPLGGRTDLYTVSKTDRQYFIESLFDKGFFSCEDRSNNYSSAFFNGEYLIEVSWRLYTETDPYGRTLMSYDVLVQEWNYCRE